jgi:hypothetical protein
MQCKKSGDINNMCVCVCDDECYSGDDGDSNSGGVHHSLSRSVREEKMNVKILKGCRIVTAQYATTGVGAPGAEKQGWDGAVGLGKIKTPASPNQKAVDLEFLCGRAHCCSERCSCEAPQCGFFALFHHQHPHTYHRHHTHSVHRSTLPYMAYHFLQVPKQHSSGVKYLDDSTMVVR